MNHFTGLPAEYWKAIADSGAAINCTPGLTVISALGPSCRLWKQPLRTLEGSISDNEITYGHDLFAETRILL
jgi:hypothetical protein